MSRSSYPTAHDSYRDIPSLSGWEIKEEIAKLADSVGAVQTRIGVTGDTSTTTIIGQLADLDDRVTALEGA